MATRLPRSYAKRWRIEANVRIRDGRWCVVVALGCVYLVADCSDVLSDERVSWCDDQCKDADSGKQSYEFEHVSDKLWPGHGRAGEHLFRFEC